MTTATNNGVIDHTTDAGFRAWIIDFHTVIAAAGLVQTADTGQVNTATVTRPAINTMAGYSTWRFPDSSLYIKFQFGTGTSAAFPAWQIQVGEGTNGSGTLTGQTSTNAAATVTNQASASTVTNYTSYCCVTNDFFGLLFKYGSTGATRGNCRGWAMVMKSVDSTGAATNTGYMVACLNASGATGTQCTTQNVRRASPAATSTAQSAGWWTTYPSGGWVNSQDDNGDVQVSLCYGAFKAVQPLLHVCMYNINELVAVSTFTTTLFGSTSHTYLVLSTAANGVEPSGNTSFSLAMLYE